MADKILFVDDEPNVLNSIRRSLRNKFDIDTAESGDEALRRIKTGGGYAVIVTDMRMPEMSGIEFLAKAKAAAPDTVRMMLTGNADQQTAVDAMNVGDVFCFLNKPCNAEKLNSALKAALRQHLLITSEKELLEQTLRGSIKALTEVLALSKPEVFGRATRLKSHMRRLAMQLKLDDLWRHESVALLSQIGCTGISEERVKQRVRGDQLTESEMAEFAEHANLGANLLSSIPRMEAIADAIRYQEKNFDGTGYPLDARQGEQIPLGARLLKVVLDFDALETAGKNGSDSLAQLRHQAAWYDPAVLAAFESSLALGMDVTVRTVDVLRLVDTMVLAQDVRTDTDLLLVAKGQETSMSVQRRLRSFLENGAIASSVKGWVREA
ncbi:MAG: response regulator [Woeseia sp.]